MASQSHLNLYSENVSDLFSASPFADCSASRLLLERMSEIFSGLEDAQKVAELASAWGSHTLSASQQALSLQIIRAEFELERAQELSVNQASYKKILKLLRRALYRAKGVLKLVCNGLVKLGADVGAVRPNFLTDYLLPLPRSDKIYV